MTGLDYFQLDDPELEVELMPAALVDWAIYTPRTKAAHLIRRVMIRMTAILNYVNPV